MTGIINSAVNPYNSGATLSQAEIDGAKAWSVGKTGAEVSAAAAQLGITPEQLSQAGITANYGGGAAISQAEIDGSRKWANGKSASEIATAGQTLGLNADQFGSVFGAQGSDVTGKGYGTTGGLQDQYKNLTYNQATNTWIAPVAPTPEPTPVDPGPGPLTVTTPPPVPITTANNFQTPVFDQLYSQMQQHPQGAARASIAAPQFNFQARPQQPTAQPAPPPGALTQAVSQPPTGV